MFFKIRRPYFYFSILLFTTLFGTLLRFVNISPYKFYPDSYQNLLVAKNIITYKSVAGALGERGMSYPPFFMWSRPVYPLFIDLGNLIYKDWVKGAQLVTFFFSILTIISVFLLTKEIFGSYFAGLIGAFLLATSFNHVVWSGFIMTESTGIFFAIIFLHSLYKSKRKTSDFAGMEDLYTGLLFALAVFTRYEYILLLIPVSYFIFNSRTPIVKVINLLSSFVFFSAIFFTFLFPVKESLFLAWNQFSHLIKWGTFGIAGFVATYLLFKKNRIIVNWSLFNSINNNFNKIISIQFFLLAGIPVILVMTNFNLPFFLGLGNFMRSDFVLTTLAFTGLGLMIAEKKLRQLGFFVLIYIVTLGIIYNRINPLQQRYFTHLIVALIIPAVYSMKLIFKKITLSKNKAVRLLFLVTLITGVSYQIYLSYWGVRKWNMRDWNKQSYEEVSAWKLRNYLKGQEFLIASMPEAYYFFTDHPTRSVSDEPPYIYLKDMPDNTEIVIVNDMGMRDIFPIFSDFSENNLKRFKVGEYFTDRNYRYRFVNFGEKYPVIIYKIKAEELKKITGS